MSESKSHVLNIRLTPVVMAALTARADAERQPVRRLAALIIEDALSKPRAAYAAPLAPAPRSIGSDEVEPRFRNPKKGGRR